MAFDQLVRSVREDARPTDDSVVTVSLTMRPDLAVLRDWDRLVETTKVGDVAQLSGWAQIRGTVGYRPLYVLVRRGPTLVGGAQILHRRIPVVGTVGYVPQGPVISPSADRGTTCELLAAQLEIVARRFAMLFVQPPLGAGDVSAALLERGFRRSAAGVAPTGSLRVGLGGDEEDLRRNLSRRLRTWTRQWAKVGVRVRVGGLEDVGVLADLVTKTAARQGFTPFSCEYLGALHRVLTVRSNAVLLIGEVRDHAVAAELFTTCGGVVTARICGLDLNPSTSRLNVASAVTWEAMRWASGHGYDEFDLGGMTPRSIDALIADPVGRVDRLDRCDQYKVKFGGRLVRYPHAVEMISTPPVRLLYDLASRNTHGRRLISTAQRLLRGQLKNGGGPR